MRPGQYEDVARISVPALIRLAEPSTALPLMPRSIRASHGGAYRSAFKGRGMEFDDVRPYQRGDDVRTLDWKVTARTGEPFTKLFREERERPVVLCLDFRLPMFFATRGAFKAVVACHAAALLAWSASRGGDRVGGLVFADDSHEEVKPQRGRAAVLHLIKRLAAHPLWGDREGVQPRGDALASALARLRRVARPGSLIFLVSDFRDLDADGVSQIRGLARHNDLGLLSVTDPLEHRLPPPGHYRLTDGRRELEIDSGDTALATAYAERFAARRARLRELDRRSDIHLIEIATDADVLATLTAGLRRPRVRAA